MAATIGDFLFSNRIEITQESVISCGPTLTSFIIIGKKGFSMKDTLGKKQTRSYGGIFLKERR
jgi:hypothetical protein